MRIPSTLPADVQQALRDVWAILGPVATTTPFSWKQRRLIDVADGTADQDAVTVRQLAAAVSGLTSSTSSTERRGLLERSGPGIVRIGPFSTRGAAVAHGGEVFIASDLQNVLWLSDGIAWHYVQGVFAATLSPDLKPIVLGSDDAGFRFFATDFNRSYTWDGSAWDDSPDSPARAQVAFFANPPIPAAGWHICDGSSVNRSTGVGGVVSVTLPDMLTDGLFIRSDGGSGATGGSVTHSHDIDEITSQDDDSSFAYDVDHGSTQSVSKHPHNHDVGPMVTSDASNLPPYITMRPYYRL